MFERKRSFSASKIGELVKDNNGGWGSIFARAIASARVCSSRFLSREREKELSLSLSLAFSCLVGLHYSSARRFSGNAFSFEPTIWKSDREEKWFNAKQTKQEREQLLISRSVWKSLHLFAAKELRHAHRANARHIVQQQQQQPSLLVLWPQSSACVYVCHKRLFRGTSLRWLRLLRGKQQSKLARAWSMEPTKARFSAARLSLSPSSAQLFSWMCHWQCCDLRRLGRGGLLNWISFSLKLARSR